MIRGTVNIHREAVIRLPVLDAAGYQREIDAIVDTGFDGWLTLPNRQISALGSFGRAGRALLADGSTDLFDIFEATVLWDGQPLTVAVDAADTDPLVGMSLLYGYDLYIQVVDGGEVRISVP